MRRARWRRGRRPGPRGVAQIIGVILLVAITVVLMVLVYLIRFPMPNPPPTLTYDSVNDARYPVWGDPTDCYPFPYLAYNVQYWLGNGTGNATDQNRWNTYMNAWWDECENSDNGTYNLMDAARIVITGVSQSIPLADLQFKFLCTNQTPRYTQTVLVQGNISDMEWVPGGSQNLSAKAPTLGTCATYDPRGSGANSVYYNRLGFFDPLNTNVQVLTPGMTLVIYIHTPDSILEAPNPLEPQSTWNQPDADDYHGAPLWCFTVPGSCTVELIDTAWGSGIVVLDAPVYML
ncbi:MAG TPA: archaellin/type IV pilin N-terminal domain-containing protein [Thermoplasmata archaeon]|nr:archaellin/type IV pilin N-terminal domain-containing protein [Thermoplasmata archaeon]